ncbi:MAG: diguanylate phosphodiesterase [Acidobacteria bacterium]|nr:diguanylate phosphodiesterase [Acidobacteriota bacterium]
MSKLIHLIYCSAAKTSFPPEEFQRLLERARLRNTELGITGMLLYADGSFFQVLEGEENVIDGLFDRIARDQRHQDITLIIREPIARRAFADWTMGYAAITAADIGDILGEEEAFRLPEASFEGLGGGRAQKLLEAFQHGRWRTKLSDVAGPALPAVPPPADGPNAAAPQTDGAPAVFSCAAWYSFAFQPIVDVTAGKIFSYEALLRGVHNEPVDQVLRQAGPAERQELNQKSPGAAIELAARLGLTTRLNLNLLPRTMEHFPSVIAALLAAANHCHIHPEQIVLEILEREMIDDFDRFNAIVNEYRGSGLVFAIDDFGAGYAGLNLLAEFQPHLIKIDMHLVRGVGHKGPRQAIIRGIVRTCFDLGIGIIAEGVETGDEYSWLRQEGIELFQGYLFARPAFEELPRECCLPE